jgi:hypothetical protein
MLFKVFTTVLYLTESDFTLIVLHGNHSAAFFETTEGNFSLALVI